MKQRGGILGGLLGTLVVVIVLAGLAAIYLRQNIHVVRNDNTVRVETPFGNIHVREGSVNPRALDLPVYPGAKLDRDRHRLASFEFESLDGSKSVAIVAAEYTTVDSSDKVLEFYRQEVPNGVFHQKKDGSWHVEFSARGAKRMIAIKEDTGQTRIALASFGEPASN